MNSEIESENFIFNNKMMDGDDFNSDYLMKNYDDDASTNNSMSINESLLELMDNDYDPELFNTNLYSEIDNVINYSSLYQGLSQLGNFKSQPIQIKKKIINIMSRKRNRNNN